MTTDDVGLDALHDLLREVYGPEGTPATDIITKRALTVLDYEAGAVVMRAAASYDPPHADRVEVDGDTKLVWVGPRMWDDVDGQWGSHQHLVHLSDPRARDGHLCRPRFVQYGPDGATGYDAWCWSPALGFHRVGAPHTPVTPAVAPPPRDVTADGMSAQFAYRLGGGDFANGMRRLFDSLARDQLETAVRLGHERSQIPWDEDCTPLTALLTAALLANPAAERLEPRWRRRLAAFADGHPLPALKGTAHYRFRTYTADKTLVGAITAPDDPEQTRSVPALIDLFCRLGPSYGEAVALAEAALVATRRFCADIARPRKVSKTARAGRRTSVPAGRITP